MSFFAIGTITSLNSGFPSRDTWLHGPCPTYAPRCSSKIRDVRRFADAQTPITEPAFPGLVGSFPLRVTSVIGTWSAIECTLNAWSEFTPGAAAIGSRCRFCTGRSAPRSKMLPRSTWNASAR